MNGNYSLHGELITACFAKSGSIYGDLPQDTQYKTLLTNLLALPQRLFLLGLCFGYTQIGHKGRCRAAVACFEAVHMARGLAVSRFLRQIEHALALLGQ